MGNRGVAPRNNPNPGWGKGQIPCFPPGTPVAAPGGGLPIESLQTGQQIFAYDQQKGAVVLRPVVATHTGSTRCWVDIALGEGATLRTTRHHPIWVETLQRWSDAIALEPGMLVRGLDGRPATVERITVQPLAQPTPTFNLQVDEAETYFAGEAPVLVHNGTPLGQPGHNVYVLKRGGKVYYVGRFGPNETVADVLYRHSNTPKNAALRTQHGARFDQAAGDSIQVVRRNVTYAEARRTEHELCVRNKTHIGRGQSWRGNRDFPMSPRRMPSYYVRNAC